MSICLECGEVNDLSVRHCRICGQRQIRRVRWEIPVVEQPLPAGSTHEILPVQEWPFEGHSLELRRSQQSTIKQILAATRQLLEGESRWEADAGEVHYTLIRPHGAYEDAEAIIDVWANDDGAWRKRFQRLASYAIFPGIIINLRGGLKAHLVNGATSSPKVYLINDTPDGPPHHEATDHELHELVRVLKR